MAEYAFVHMDSSQTTAAHSIVHRICGLFGAEMSVSQLSLYKPLTYSTWQQRHYTGCIGPTAVPRKRQGSDGAPDYHSNLGYVVDNRISLRRLVAANILINFSLLSLLTTAPQSAQHRENKPRLVCEHETFPKVSRYWDLDH